MPNTIEIVGIYISPAHVYAGHHGREPGSEPMVEVSEIECVAGQGLVGDRYFGHKPDFKGQITFFSTEVFETLAKSVGAEADKTPADTRRNVIVRGIDLKSLIGRTFHLGELHLEGVEECRPCYWMDQAIAEGANEGLRGRGGLRARILQGGFLRTGAVDLTLDP